jgi:hypothetical protein
MVGKLLGSREVEGEHLDASSGSERLATDEQAHV